MQALYQLKETVKTLQKLFPQPAFELMVQQVIEDYVKANNITGLRAYDFIKCMLKKRKITMTWYNDEEDDEDYGKFVEYSRSDFMLNLFPRERIIKDINHMYGFDVTHGQYYLEIPKYKDEDYFRRMFVDEEHIPY